VTSENDDVCAIVGFGPGVGLAVAERFAREGFALQLFARNQEKLDSYVDQFRARGTRAVGKRADAGQFAQLRQAMSDAADELGAPSVLVYNASHYSVGKASTVPPEDLSAALDVGATGMIAAAQFALEGMRRRERGTILVSGGWFAIKPAAPFALMSACKAALRSLTLTLAEDAATMGVHVVCFSHSTVVTPQSAEARIIADAYWNLHSQPREEWLSEAEWNGWGWWPYADGGEWVRKRAVERAREIQEAERA
jgi:NAD(P)-dependent dehydrogenase (short-subunit alcohol dehydrogenase family)